MSRVLFLLIANLFWIQGAWARWANPNEEGAVLESYILTTKVRADGSYEQINEQLWHAQSEEGKLGLAVRQIEYNSFTDKVEVLEAKTINGKNSYPVPASAIEDRDKGEARDYDAVKVKSLVFPQVQVGSRLLLRYRIVVSPASLKGKWSTDFEIQPGLLIEKIRMEIESELPLTFAVTGGDFFDVKSTGKKLVAKSKRPTQGQAVGEKNIYFSPERNHHLVITTDPVWSSFFAQVTDDFEKALSQPLPKDLKSWAAIKASDEEKILKTLEKISSGFRYFGDWRRVRGGYVPRSLTEIENSRYGDCKDLSLMLTRILREEGFRADVALVRRGPNPWVDEPAPKLPTLSLFNHAIVRAEKDGKVWWLDPTNAVASLVPAADIAGRSSWVLGKNAKLDRIPTAVPQDYQYEDQSVYRFQKGGGVKVEVLSRQKKSAAAQLAYNLLTNPLERILFNVLEFYSDGNEIQESSFIRSPKSSRRLQDLEFSLSYQTQSVTYRTPAGLFFPLRETILSGAFFETRNRASDISIGEFPYTHQSERIFKDVKMLGEFKDCSVQSKWADLSRSVKNVGRDVHLRMETVLHRPTILQSEYDTAEFRRVQSEVRDCFYRVGLVFEPL